MQTSGVVGVACLAALALLALPGGTARACSVCMAGDPIFDAQGAAAQQEGDFSAYLELRTASKKSGALPNEGGAGGEGQQAIERNTSTWLRLMLAWTPLDRLTLSVDVPLAYTQIEEVEEDTVTPISTV